jgi:hypothetical protein
LKGIDMSFDLEFENAHDIYYDKRTFCTIFELIWKLVLSDGGDGTGMIYCTYNNYKEVSRLFKYYIDNWLQKDNTLEFIEYEDYNLITDGINENFIITSSHSLLQKEIENETGTFIIKI